MGDLFGAPPLGRYVPSRSLIWRTRSSVTALLLVVVTGTVVAVVVVAGTRLAVGGLATHQIRIVALTSTADWCDVTVKTRNVLVNLGRRCAQRSVKSCAGVVRLASTWKAGFVSVAEAKQLSFFRG